MAGNDPWLNWGWLKVGPFTPTEEERVAADRRRQEIKTGERQARASDIKDKTSGLPALLGRGGGDPWFRGGGISIGPFTPDEASRQQAEMRAAQLSQAEGQARASAIKDRDMLPRQQYLSQEQKAAAAQTLPQQMPVDQGNPQLQQPWPENTRDWSFGQGLVAPFMEGGTEAWQAARARDAAAGAATTPTQTGPQPNQAITDAAAAANAGVGPLATAAGIGGIDAAPPAQDIPAQPMLSPQQQAIEDIKRQRAMIDAIYPQRTVDDTAEKAADAYALDERNRAKMMAQLAFFSGVTQGAGGQWEGVGKGLAAAGGAYSEGFARYQKALMGKAERASERLGQKYTDETARSDAAIKLYAQQQGLEKDRMSEARLAGKERMANIDEWFKELLKVAGGNEFAPPDQNRVDDIMRDWRISRERGEIIQTRNAKDAPSS